MNIGAIWSSVWPYLLAIFLFGVLIAIHEFGHFADGFINDGDDTSIDQQEISSQGLEYIMLHHLSGILPESDIKYLKYLSLCSAMEVLLFQGFYARFEEIAYALPYDMITKENLDKAIATAAEEFGLNTEYVNDISIAFIPHIFLYPFYVQSYCASIVPALQLYFLEDEESGKGLEAYKMIIDRTENDLTFKETLELAGLPSVFEDGALRNLSDKIYYSITGSHYYGDADNDQSAA